MTDTVSSIQFPTPPLYLSSIHTCTCQSAHLFSVKVSVSTEAAPSPRKREHGQRNGDGHVDADLPHVNLALELASNGAGRGEDGRSVAVWVGVDHLDGLGMRRGHL